MARHEQQRNLRFGNAREVVKVRIWAVGVLEVARPDELIGGIYDRDRIRTDRLGQTAAIGGMKSGREGFVAHGVHII
jgi:hypothetical protein